jgi:hypothetical protein
MGGGSWPTASLVGVFRIATASSGYSMAELVGGLQGNGKVDGSITVLSQVEQQVGSALLGIGQQALLRASRRASTPLFGSPAAERAKRHLRYQSGVLNTRPQPDEHRARLLATGDANIAA